MFCTKCGTQNLEEAKFCKKCGIEINNTSLQGRVNEKKRNYYFEVIKKYGVFKGRSSRKEYWMFVLINFLVYVGIAIIEGLLGVNSEGDGGVISIIYQIFIFIPSLAVTVRRMHDVDKSDWYIIIPIYNLILLASEGTSGDNNYGPNPKLTD